MVGGDYYGTLMGTDIFQSPTELGIRTVKQEKEIELLKKQIQEQQYMQYQISGYTQPLTCDSSNSYTTVGNCWAGATAAPVKKDKNKLKNLIAYYYKR